MTAPSNVPRGGTIRYHLHNLGFEPDASDKAQELNDNINSFRAITAWKFISKKHGGSQLLNEYVLAFIKEYGAGFWPTPNERYHRHLRDDVSHDLMIEFHYPYATKRLIHALEDFFDFKATQRRNTAGRDIKFIDEAIAAGNLNCNTKQLLKRHSLREMNEQTRSTDNDTDSAYRSGEVEATEGQPRKRPRTRRASRAASPERLQTHAIPSTATSTSPRGSKMTKPRVLPASSMTSEVLGVHLDEQNVMTERDKARTMLYVTATGPLTGRAPIHVPFSNCTSISTFFDTMIRRRVPDASYFQRVKFIDVTYSWGNKEFWGLQRGSDADWERLAKDLALAWAFENFIDECRIDVVIHIEPTPVT